MKIESIIEVVKSAASTAEVEAKLQQLKPTKAEALEALEKLGYPKAASLKAAMARLVGIAGWRVDMAVVRNMKTKSHIERFVTK